MKTETRKLKSTQKRQKMVNGISKADLVAFVLFGGAFVITIIFGIFGGWKNILWWAVAAALALEVLSLSYSKMGKRAFRLSKIFVLVGFLVLFPLFSAGVISTYQSAAQNLTAPTKIEYFRTLLVETTTTPSCINGKTRTFTGIARQA